MGVAVGVGGGAGVQDDGSGRRHSTIEVTAAATTTGRAALPPPPPPPNLGGCICGREMSRVSERRARETVRVRLDTLEQRYGTGGSDGRRV